MALVERNERRVLGGALMRIRTLKQIKQASLAQAVKVSAPYLSKIESGERQPSLDVMVRLANELAIDLDEFTYTAKKVYVVAEDDAA